MRDSLSELILFAIFGLALLFQMVLKFLRKKAAETQVGHDDVQTNPSPTPPLPMVLVPSGDTEDERTVTIEPPRQRPQSWERPVLMAPQPYSAYAGRPMRRRVRRFSRAALMGDRRAVQDAVVIAAILRPCHAHKPYGVDG